MRSHLLELHSCIRGKFLELRSEQLLRSFHGLSAFDQKIRIVFHAKDLV